MKVTLQLALLLFVFLGIQQAAFSDPLPFNVNSGWSASSACDAAYQSGCPGVLALFNEHPIPIGAIDEDTGREIIGWEIICEDGVLIDQGSDGATPEDSRVVPRSFGGIRLHYAPKAK